MLLLLTLKAMTGPNLVLYGVVFPDWLLTNKLYAFQPIEIGDIKDI